MLPGGAVSPNYFTAPGHGHAPSHTNKKVAMGFASGSGFDQSPTGGMPKYEYPEHVY